MEMPNNIIVYRGSLCNFLLNKGYTIASVAENKFSEGRTVFYFKKEGNIKREIDNFYISRQLNKLKKD